MCENKLSILALEPYHGGSHKAFLDGWIKNSCHEWTVLGLKPRKWKWRVRHSPYTFAEQLEDIDAKKFDLVFATSMLNIPLFKGLSTEDIFKLPYVLYFHENQLTYPLQNQETRDYDTVFSSFFSCLAADQVWFNSDFNRTAYLNKLPSFLKRMPDYKLSSRVKMIWDKTRIHAPGIKDIALKEREPSKSLRILWAARWEHDKNPEDFFAALEILEEQGVDYSIDVIGEQFRSYPEIFDTALEKFKHRINNWGYQRKLKDYHHILQQADVVVSTAIHEFFGITILEAVSAGCFPLVPSRLAYPEVLTPADESMFYDGTVADLAAKLITLAGKKQAGFSPWNNLNITPMDITSKYTHKERAFIMDNALAEIVQAHNS